MPDTAKRIPLILWSGGLDSTYLLYRELLTTDVDTLEVTFLNTYDHHREAEGAARDSIVKYLGELHEAGILLGKIRTRQQLTFEYPFAAQYKGIMLSHAGQQPAWLFCAFMNHDPRIHSDVFHGAVLGDTISMLAPEMIKTWDAFVSIVPATTQHRYYDRLPKSNLVFPLLYGCIGKELVWNGFSFELDVLEKWNRVRKLTWSCYKPGHISNDDPDYNGVNYLPCGECDSCQRDPGLKDKPIKPKTNEVLLIKEN